MKKYNIAVVGATGLVGRTILRVLEEKKFPINNIYFLSSKKSAGSTISFNGQSYIVEELNEKSFDKPIDIALFVAGGHVSEKYVPIAVEKGVQVIDNSSVVVADNIRKGAATNAVQIVELLANSQK